MGQILVSIGLALALGGTGTMEAAGEAGATQAFGWREALASTIKLILAWSVFLGSLWLLERVLDQAADSIQRWFARLAERRAAQGLVALMFERIMLLALMAARLAAAVLVLAGVSVLLTYSFSLLPAAEDISVSLLAALWSALTEA